MTMINVIIALFLCKYYTSSILISDIFLKGHSNKILEIYVHTNIAIFRLSFVGNAIVSV